MARLVAERYAVAAFGFIAAATWLGVGLIHGLLCLLASLLAAQATRIYQRRSDSRSRVSARQRHRERARPRPVAERPQRSRLYDGDGEDFDWPTAGDAAW